MTLNLVLILISIICISGIVSVAFYFQQKMKFDFKSERERADLACRMADERIRAADRHRDEIQRFVNGINDEIRNMNSHLMNLKESNSREFVYFKNFLSIKHNAQGGQHGNASID